MTKTADVMRLMRERFSPPQFVLLENVRNGTGYVKGERYADALAMSVWPSRGLELMGFEVKASRSDWLRELENPAKAEEIAAYCDRWWVVVGEERIVAPGELPPTWGLIVASKNAERLVTKVDAPKLEAKPLDRLLLAAILRRVGEQWTPTARLNAVVEEQTKAEVEAANRRAESDVKAATHEAEKLRRSIDTFETASGVKIDGWNARYIGDAVRTVLAANDLSIAHRLANIRRELESALASVAKAQSGQSEEAA